MGGRGRELLLRTLASAGFTQSESQISAQAQEYWTDTGVTRWKADSHWRDANVFGDGDLWFQLGRRHLELFERGARKVEFTRPWRRVVEWGCGGGANAVHFAPRAEEFVGVDISAESLAECGRQVAAQCDTAYRPVLVEVAEPERAVAEIGGECDVFLCCYVFELIPTPEYGERLLRIAAEVLAPGGLALIQVKYDDGRFFSRPRRRSYRSGVAEMTTYPIAGFWELAERCGLRPESVELVPRNELDSRYAYFLLSKA
ncbi:class I SAM-dependent methyltransferase [Actinophytocola sp.]|uniref:class I SAM-dependent methyltransferase n=1 Tax=Actinophytocola sp. TaxID=1872138 RepID=UPI002D8112A0|nr:class I SAM-dependent methyltransferase [Actinophytocola sp.]HET9138551.1 class I SAM-dependent methyltransferase [Actinophytocola sp.]